MADNILALNGEWDLELLRKEVAAAEDELRKLDVFSDQEYDELLADLDRETGAGDEDDAPDVPRTPVTLAGDLWMLGSHRVLCGDCTLMDNLEKVLAGAQADLVFTDPPYNCSFLSKQGRPRPIVNDNLVS
jgi:16S rRNA G966 N2-methylase RsmD